MEIGGEVYKKAYLELPRDISPIGLVSQFLKHCATRGVLRENSKILSQGCEIGTWEKALLKELPWYLKKAEIIGVDINQRFLRKSKKVMSVLACDVRNLSFVSGFFDISYSPLVLQWLSPEDRPKNLKETARILKRGGEALFIVPSLSHLEKELAFLPQFSKISMKELGKKKGEFFLPLRQVMNYALEWFSVIEGWEVKREFIPTPEQRQSLIYTDTIASIIEHDEKEYCDFLQRMTQPTTIHWVMIGCTK